MDLLTQLHQFFGEPKYENLLEAFPDDRLRVSVKMACNREL